MGLGLKKILFSILIKHIKTIALLLCAASVAGTVLLPLNFSRGTYFSENSLMIGGTRNPIVRQDVARVLSVAEELKKAGENGWGELTESFVKTRIKGGLLEVQNGTKNRIIKVESDRGFGSSAFLITVWWRDTVSLSLSLEILAKVSGEAYLGLDVYLVVVGGESYRTGVENFSKYLTETSGREFHLNTGFIKACIALDYHNSNHQHSITHLQTLSTNAYQPNMDLVNSVSALFKNKSAYTVFQGGEKRLPVYPEDEWGFLWNLMVAVLPNPRTGSAKELWNNFWSFWGYCHAALCSEGAVHTSLRDVGVHAVTLKGEGNTGNSHDNILETSAVIVGILRGMNNLCERLHQSFWIYFYTNNNHFVDYDTVQAVIWIGIASSVASSFSVDEQPYRVGFGILLAFLSGFHLIAVIPVAFIIPKGVFVPLHFGFTWVSTIFIASCTVHYCPLALFASPVVAFLSNVARPCGSVGGRLFKTVLVLSLLPVIYVAVPHPELLTSIPWVFYRFLLLPYVAACLGRILRG
eukprot:TRINITY_DN19225_c0_g1_i1.p1 TRINITY_DN19225_c0_g1~~TRINITY_DN19225_c0_g1_i1.p1  ORF type:complete len:542 (+),score=45.17 TRINITY_DN19225_c0_g1_i1:60-1628(+)